MGVGADRVAESAGANPRFLALGIAAAFCFNPEEDPASVELQNRVAADGIKKVLADLCGIRADEPLGKQVLADFSGLRTSPDYLARQV